MLYASGNLLKLSVCACVRFKAGSNTVRVEKLIDIVAFFFAGANSTRVKKLIEITACISWR